MAVVTSTGFMTAKGSLVSAIMYPPPVDFRFERDSYRFIGFLASLASIGFTYSIIKKVNKCLSERFIIFLILLASIIPLDYIGRSGSESCVSFL
jgi:cation-transporting ATPase 13A3/4/5